MIEDNALNYTKTENNAHLMLSRALACTSFVPTSFATDIWIGFLNCDH